MANFQYEWWTVDIRYRAGTFSTEFKGKNRDSVIRQIKKEEASDDLVVEVLWDTLHMDRKGYQRRF